MSSKKNIPKLQGYFQMKLHFMSTFFLVFERHGMPHFLEKRMTQKILSTSHEQYNNYVIRPNHGIKFTMKHCNCSL